MKILLVLLILLTNSSRFAFLEGANESQEKSLCSWQPEIKQQVGKLKQAYKKLLSSPSNKEYQQGYFDAFPNNFKMFNKIFGYSDKEPMGEGFNPGPLYNESLPPD